MMKKYYIGLAVLGAVSAALVLFVITKGLGGRQDRQLEKTSQNIAIKLNSYTADKGVAPKSLVEAGVKNAPSSISYKVIDGGYEFCATYKSAGTSIDINPTNLLLNAAYSGAISEDFSGYEPPYDYGVSGTLIISNVHKKGANCQKVMVSNYGSIDYGNLPTPSTDIPVGSAEESSGATLDTHCPNPYTTNFTIKTKATVKSIDTTAGTITLEPTGQTLEQTASTSKVSSITSKKYDNSTNFFDASCKKTTVSALKVGSTATFYVTSSYSGYFDQVEL